MESLSPVPSNAEKISRPPLIQRLSSAFLIAFAELVAQEAHAQEDVSVAEMPSAKPYISPVAELQLFRTAANPQLDNDDSLIRHTAQKDIQDAIRRALIRKNPIDDKDLLMNPSGSLEQKVRMKRLNAFAQYEREVLPTVLHNEKNTHVLLHSQLSSAWQLPFGNLPEETIGQEVLLKPHESMKTLDALKLICLRSGCVPHLQGTGITLTPAKEQESIWTDGILFWVREEIEGRLPRFRMFVGPDYGSIAQLENQAAFEQGTAVIQADSLDHAWVSKNGIPPPKKDTPIGQHTVRVSFIRKQIRGTLVLSKDTRITLGPQTISFIAPEKMEGIWKTKIQGACFPELAWTATTAAQDTPLYQVTAHNRYQPKDHNGRVLSCQVSHLTFTQRDFEVTLETSEEPHSIHIVAFDTPRIVDIHVPTLEVMEKVTVRKK